MNIHLVESLLFQCAPAFLLGLTVLAFVSRRAQRIHHTRNIGELKSARQHGSHAARLLHPEVDLAKCIGCGACVNACPEQGVLSLIYGQAAVVHGMRCVGHGECASACPTGAILLTLGDLSNRQDMPAIDEALECVGVPGMYLAGELTGFALVRTAVSHGVAVADAVSRQAAGKASDDPSVLDLLVIGAGPGGLACSLRAKEKNLRFVTIEQEPRIGGTIAAYPRRKLVMTQPLQLPLYGRLPGLSYSKEELIAIWEKAIRDNQLPIKTGIKLQRLSRSNDGVFIATTTDGTFLARNVCLALGRRGSPKKLNVPGEDLAKVSYSLIDAASYTKRKILIVGGGDSAIEAALALGIQPGNQVTISYRRASFVRLKSQNEVRIQQAVRGGTVRVIFESELAGVEEGRVQLRLAAGAAATLDNDDVFIFAGGEPPFELLAQAGVSFDPANRPRTEVARPSAGLLGLLIVAFFCAVVLAVWAMWFHSYYGLDSISREESNAHRLLGPTGPIGLSAGIAGCAMFLANLLYLVRRAPSLGRFLPGSRPAWMQFHVFTGLLGALFILLHCGFEVRPTVGGHAMAALFLVIVTGSVGRYLYSVFPRAANGSESSLDELRVQIANLSSDWDREGRGFGGEARRQIDELILEGRWRSSLIARLRKLILGQIHLRQCIRRLKRLGHAESVPDDELSHVLELARRAHRLTLLVTHYDEFASVVATWRYFHRWIALLMVLLTIVHIVMAVRYASVGDGLHRLIEFAVR